jgi:Rad3-related DNA helicase
MVVADDPGAAAEIDRLWKQFHDSLKSAYRAAVDLMLRFRELSAAAGRVADRPDSPGSSIRYLEGSPLLLGLETEGDLIRQQLGRMHGNLETLAEIMNAHEVLAEAGTAATVRLLRDVTRETLDALSFVLSASDENYVFYAGLSAEGEVSNLSASPIDVSAQLGAFLEEAGGGVVLTSATLSVGDDFSYLLGQLGLSRSPRVDTRRYSSPFDLDRQRRVFLAQWLPDPKDDGFVTAAADTVGRIVEAIPRKTLVLCTSHRQLGVIKRTLRDRPGLDRLTLAQTAGSSRSDLMNRFKHDPEKQVLLGLVSFWEGVDFPGELLELVIIVKMPFLVPTEPVAQARTDRLRAAGEDPFMDYVLPDSILKLRQGSGRLIRTGRDRGAVIVLDSRLDHRPYGQVVLDAVYKRVIRADSGEAMLTGLERMFSH